jgi:hypothetical protein
MGAFYNALAINPRPGANTDNLSIPGHHQDRFGKDKEVGKGK